MKKFDWCQVLKRLETIQHSHQFLQLVPTQYKNSLLLWKIFFTYNLLTIESFRIGVPSILFLSNCKFYLTIIEVLQNCSALTTPVSLMRENLRELIENKKNIIWTYVFFYNRSLVFRFSYHGGRSKWGCHGSCNYWKKRLTKVILYRVSHRFVYTLQLNFVSFKST